MSTTDSNISPTSSSKQLANGIVGTIRGESVAVDTATGAAWIEKYLHPPVDKRSTYAGIPDLNNTPSVHLEYRAVNEITTDRAVPTTNDKLLFLQSASACWPVFTFDRNSEGNFVQLPSLIQENPNIKADDFLKIASSGRIAYKSTTYSLNATDFNNQGVVTTASFRPNYETLDIEELAAKLLLTKSYQALDNLYNAVNKIDSLSDDFVNLSVKSKAQIKESKDLSYAEKAQAILATSKFTHAQVIDLVKIPASSTEVLMLSPKATSTKAVEGAFVVQKFSQPVNTFKSYTYRDGKLPGTGSAVIAPLIFYCTQEEQPLTKQLTTVYYNFNWAPPGELKDFYPCEDLPWSDFTWSWVMFEGLSVTQNAVTAVSPPYITIKSITGYEAQPTVNSPFTPLMTLSAVPDETALRMASMIAHQMQDSMPAKFNAIGAALAAAAQAAPMIMDTVKSVFGKKEEKPKTPTKRRPTKVQNNTQVKPAPRKPRYRRRTANQTNYRRRRYYRRPQQQLPVRKYRPRYRCATKKTIPIPKPRKTASILNPEAPEFIPTMTFTRSQRK